MSKVRARALAHFENPDMLRFERTGSSAGIQLPFARTIRTTRRKGCARPVKICRRRAISTSVASQRLAAIQLVMVTSLAMKPKSNVRRTERRCDRGCQWRDRRRYQMAPRVSCDSRSMLIEINSRA
jgi:hypothetical protein